MIDKYVSFLISMGLLGFHLCFINSILYYCCYIFSLRVLKRYLKVGFHSDRYIQFNFGMDSLLDLYLVVSAYKGSQIENYLRLLILENGIYYSLLFAVFFLEYPAPGYCIFTDENWE